MTGGSLPHAQVTAMHGSGKEQESAKISSVVVLFVCNFTFED